jgi:hypothetical protein
MSEVEGEHRRRRVRGSRPGRLSRGAEVDDPSTDESPRTALEASHTSGPGDGRTRASASDADAPIAEVEGEVHVADAHTADTHTAEAPTGEPPNASGTPNETPNGGVRSNPVPAPSRLARFGAKRSAERPRPEPRPWSRGERAAPSSAALPDRAARSERPDKTDRDTRDRSATADRSAGTDRGNRGDRGTRADRGAPGDREPFDSHTPGSTEDHERGLRGLIGGGSSQVSVTAAMRARDASRPTDADIANAEQTLAIVHRGWVPRD